jgi:glycosyltransferase involved in cell wall biosynthesis
MSKQVPHICVCICTYQRPEYLRHLLREVAHQDTNSEFAYSVVVVDNDELRSAESVVAEMAGSLPISIRYFVEPERNIARARNRALQNALGDFIAFIDDDEYPVRDWLLNLLTTQRKYDVAGVLGPVLPDFESTPPDWIVKGKFFERPNPETGYKVPWADSRTGNVLFRRAILKDSQVWFAPEFGSGGEDVDFFRRMNQRGHAFVWCREAAAYEWVPASRCNRRYLLSRALLRGSNARKRRSGRLLNIVKSVIALPVYILILPVLALVGQHWFITYLIKLCDHASRLLAFAGVNLVTERKM